MNFEKFQRIQQEKPNLREIPDATAIGDYRNTGCGDNYRIFLKVDGKGVIEDAAFTTTGCGFGMAALALACDVAKGKTVDEAAAITTDMIEAGVEGFPPKRKNYPQSALEALHVALDAYRKKKLGAASRLTREEALSKRAAGESLSGLGGIGLDLSGCDLRGADFSDGNWDGADFTGANLEGADFHKCALRKIKAARANFHGANFRRSDLSGGAFAGANLSGADLRNTFLNDADLTGADLSGADLRFCKLTGIKMDGTKFDGALYDKMTRFDPGMVKPYEAMVRKEEEAELFIAKPAASKG